MKLILVRHGQTEWNKAQRIQGQSESDLTTLGIEQADATAQALADTTIHAIISSDSRRAMDTAHRIAAPHGLETLPDRRLREMAFGSLEGLTWEEIRSRFPEARAAIQSGLHDFAMPGGGESRDDLLSRTLGVLDEIAVRYPDQTVCVVTHGGLIVWFARHVLGIPKDVPSFLRPDNCAIHRFELREIGWFLRTWNERCHLPSENGDANLGWR